MRFHRTLLVLPLAILILARGGFAAGKQITSDKTANYSVTKKVIEGHTTYHLRDSARKMEVGIAPEIGNFAYEFKANGKDILIAPESIKDYLQKHWFGWGNPFMAPFANRIDQDYYYFQGKKYLLNDTLGNILRVPPNNYALHGLLVFEPRWQVVNSGGSDAGGAFLTSRLEFYKYPDLMANFPFAHGYEITYRLKDGMLQCTTQVANVGNSVMPVHFGFHPYFRPDGPRENWALGISARKHWLTERESIPTGETEPTEKFLPGSTKGVALGNTSINAGFSDFERDENGLGRIWVKGQTQRIEVIFGKEFDYAIVYAPLDSTLVCIEPQTGPTNAFNLEYEGKFKGLLTLQPGKTFKASYWIVPTGF